MQAYCVKCRAKREMKDPKSITMKNGRPATQGTCPTCGTKMFRIGKSQLRAWQVFNRKAGSSSVSSLSFTSELTSQADLLCETECKFVSADPGYTWVINDLFHQDSETNTDPVTRLFSTI